MPRPSSPRHSSRLRPTNQDSSTPRLRSSFPVITMRQPSTLPMANSRASTPNRVTIRTLPQLLPHGQASPNHFKPLKLSSTRTLKILNQISVTNQLRLRASPLTTRSLVNSASPNLKRLPLTSSPPPPSSHPRQPSSQNPRNPFSSSNPLLLLSSNQSLNPWPSPPPSQSQWSQLPLKRRLKS
jgi:hypothetical protein